MRRQDRQDYLCKNEGQRRELCRPVAHEQETTFSREKLPLISFAGINWGLSERFDQGKLGRKPSQSLDCN